MRRELVCRALAEALGTGLLVTIVVDSDITAQRLPLRDTGLKLLENSTAIAPGLAVLFLILGPVSGSRFKPVVMLADHQAVGFVLAAVVRPEPGAAESANQGAVEQLQHGPRVRRGTREQRIVAAYLPGMCSWPAR